MNDPQSVMVNELTANDPLMCENACKNQNDCVWFTYYSNEGLCVLLDECVLLKNVPGTISGRSKCGGLPECNLIGRCTGVLLNVAKAETPDACLEICQSDEMYVI